MNKASTSNPSGTEQAGKKQQEPVIDQAKHAVTHVADQAKEQVSNQLNTRKDRAVETIGTVADAIRGTSEKLKGVGPLGDVAERAADRIEDVADFFEGKRVGDIVREVESFARREPAIFLGATFALGLIGGRFLKSSVAKGGGARSGYGQGGSFDREVAFQSSYAEEYGAGYLADEDFLADDSFDAESTSQRSGSLPRGRSNTLPLGSRSTAPITARGGAGATQGSTGATQGSTGATQGSTSATQSSTGATQSSTGATQGSTGATQGSTGSGSAGSSSYGTSGDATKGNKPGGV